MPCVSDICCFKFKVHFKNFWRTSVLFETLSTRHLKSKTGVSVATQKRTEFFSFVNSKKSFKIVKMNTSHSINQNERTIVLQPEASDMTGNSVWRSSKTNEMCYLIGLFHSLSLSVSISVLLSVCLSVCLCFCFYLCLCISGVNSQIETKLSIRNTF